MWKIIKFLAPPLLTLLTFLDLFGFRQLVKFSPNGRSQIYFAPLLIAMEYYSYQAIKTVAKNKWVLIFYIVTTLLIYAGLFYYIVPSKLLLYIRFFRIVDCVLFTSSNVRSYLLHSPCVYRAGKTPILCFKEF